MASKARLTHQRVSSKLIKDARDFAPRVRELSGKMAEAGFFTHCWLSDEPREQACQEDLETYAGTDQNQLY